MCCTAKGCISATGIDENYFFATRGGECYKRFKLKFQVLYYILLIQQGVMCYLPARGLKTIMDDILYQMLYKCYQVLLKIMTLPNGLLLSPFTFFLHRSVNEKYFLSEWN